MSQFVPGVIKSFEAGEDLSSYQWHFVAATGTADSNKVSHAGANATTVGILYNKPGAVGKEAQVIITGTAKLKINEAIGMGKQITSTGSATGEVVDAAGEWIGAVALEYGAAQNDIIEVNVTSGEAYASDV